MFEGYLYDCKTKRKALENALSKFGKDAFRILFSQLEDKYILIIDESSPCSSVEDIDNALIDFGGGNVPLTPWF